MSHESVISDLKKLIKQGVTSIDPLVYASGVTGESDRASLILHAAMIEDYVLWRLKGRMPTLNRDESDRIFNFEGPCGSFSNRIRLAQGLGIIDRPLRRLIEITKELRNVAAHCHSPIQYDTPQIKAAIVHIFAPASGEVAALDTRRLRNLYGFLAMAIVEALQKPNEPVDLTSVIETERLANAGTHPASPEK